jgi:hypothetical protein
MNLMNLFSELGVFQRLFLKGGASRSSGSSGTGHALPVEDN